jgi:hypothetical protein
MHETQIINLAMLPIEQLSEEAQNKDIKRFREHHPRKSSRQNTKIDSLRTYYLRNFYLKSMEIIPKTHDSPLERNKTDAEM